MPIYLCFLTVIMCFFVCLRIAHQVLAQIKRDGIQELVVLPLYPHYSISTSASSLKIIKAIFDK